MNPHIKSDNLAKTEFLLFLLRKKLLQASCELLKLCLQLSENIELTTLFRDNGKGALKLEYRNVEKYEEIKKRGAETGI